MHTIVIVGGGSIGLSTAYNRSFFAMHGLFALRASRDRNLATSTSCQYSFDFWAAEAKNEEFKETTGYRAHSFFGVNPGNGHGIEALPKWVKAEPTWDIDRDVLGVYNAMLYVFSRTCLVLGFNIDKPAVIRLASTIGSKLEFAGRNDGTIWVCGRRNPTSSLPPPGQTADPDEGMIEELIGRAKTWLNSKCRPATKSGLPVMSEVPPSDLSSTPTYTVQAAKLPSGVFVCWGHGSYGLTLGMGTGKLMGQLMCGENPDLDLSLFALSQDNDEANNPSPVNRPKEKP